MPILFNLLLSLGSFVAISSGGVTLTAAAETAVLGQQLGRRITVEPALANENLFVQPHGASAKVILGAMATALYATVLESPQGIVVRRTKQNTSSLTARRTEMRSRWITKRLADMSSFRKENLVPGMEAAGVVGQYERVKALVEAYQRGAGGQPPSEDAGDLLPAAALLKSLVERIGVDKVAAIPSMQCVVYEDKPVPGANALPAHADFDKEFVRSIKPFETAERPKVTIPPFGPDPFLGWGEAVNPPEKLRVGIVSYDNGIYFTLDGYDRAGKRSLTSTIGVNSAPLRDSRHEVSVPSASRDRWIDLPSGDAKAAAVGRDQPDGNFPEWLVSPTQIEPVAGVVADALSAIASDHTGDCVVISSTDDLWDIARNCVKGGRLDLDVFQRSAAEWSTYEWIAANGQFVGRPRDPLSCEITRSDRKVLSAFVDDFKRLNVADARLEGRLFHDAAPSIGNLAVEWDFLTRSCSAGWSEPGNLTTYFYRLIGGIGDADWADLCGGKTRTIGQLGVTAELRALLNSDAALPAELPPGMAEIYRHPNELFPNGGWEDVAVSVQRIQTPMCRIWPAEYAEYPYWTPYSQVAGTLAFRVRAVPDPATGKFKVPVSEENAEKSFADYRFRLGMRQDEIITLHLPGGARIDARGPCYAIPTTDPGRYEDLPKRFRDEFWPLICRQSLDTAERSDRTRIRPGDSVTPPSKPPPP